ncbi:hypothetical protein [Nocardia altamirensis]|uniref:hypothetical protein n=1 Tax=Nocardia altamirensis TaxID=472158 RepID=UPI0008402822|nr:hypothetical protein [Nocardia altamirensis]
MVATKLPAGWSIHIKPAANIDINLDVLTLLDDLGAERQVGFAAGRSEPSPSELTVHRLGDIRSRALRDRARELIRTHVDRIATVNANIAAYTAAVPEFDQLTERLRRTGCTIATSPDDNALTLITTLAAPAPAAGTLLRQLDAWLSSAGLAELPAGITPELDDDTLALTITVDQAHAVEFLPWLHRQPAPGGLDPATVRALREILAYNFDDERADYRLQDKDGRQAHILNNLSSVARWLFTTTAAATPVQLPADLRGALPADFTAAHVASIMDRVHDATGFRIVCVWDYHSDKQFDGHTEFAVVDEFGQLYELTGNLLGWLRGGPGAPACPGSPASWIGEPGTEDHITASDLARGQDPYNYAIDTDSGKSTAVTR